MPKNLKPLTLVNPKRFRTIQDMTKMRPDCGASIDDIFVIDDEYLLIVDIAYLGGILNPYTSPSASYVRIHGVIVGGYHRSVACPVLWSDPFLLLPVSQHLKEDLIRYEDIGTVVGNIFCPSGSLLFLPVRRDIPTPLDSIIDGTLSSEDAVKIKLSNGTYRVFFEQFETPAGSKKESYQNIAVQKQ